MKSNFIIFLVGLISMIADSQKAFTAERIGLGMPIDCKAGVTCDIQKYVDMDPSPNAKDFKCGTLSTNHHKGTDIRLPSYREMEAGVDILAAADGTIVNILDGMPDVSSKLMTYDVVTKRGYGNRIAIQHADKYMTLYAHLKRDSLKVKVGDVVKKGEVIGQVGMSGLTEYPHLHFELRHDHKILDPFSGMQQSSGCGQYKDDFWDEEASVLLTYNPTFLISAGFSSASLNRDAAEYQIYEDEISSKTNILLFNVYIAGLHLGDQFQILIINPDGKSVLFDGMDSFNKGYVVRHLAGGKSNMTIPLSKGVYTGEFILTRNQEKLITARKTVEIY